MSRTIERPFTAATNKLAYAQAFTRSVPPVADHLTHRRSRLAALLHRHGSGRRTAG